MQIVHLENEANYGIIKKNGKNFAKFELPAGDHKFKNGFDVVVLQTKEEMEDVVLDEIFSDEDNDREIKTRLFEIDLKTIRALRESDTARLQQLNNQAVSLRNNLKKKG